MNEENNKISSPKYSLLMAIICFSCFIKRDLLLSLITFIIILISTAYICWDNKNTQNSDIKNIIDKIIIFFIILTILSFFSLFPIISMESNTTTESEYALKFFYDLRLASSFGILLIWLKSLRQKLELNLRKHASLTQIFCILILFAVASIAIGQYFNSSDLGIFFAVSFIYEAIEITLNKTIEDETNDIH